MWKIPLFSSVLGVKNAILECFSVLYVGKYIMFLCATCEKCCYVSLYYVWKMPLFSSVLGVKIGILFICTMCEKLHYFPIYSLGMVLRGLWERLGAWFSMIYDGA